MKFKNVAATGAVLVTVAIALSACSSSSTTGSSTTAAPSTTAAAEATSAPLDASLTGTITAGGSSAQANAETAWITAYNAQVKGVTVNYDKSQGSGGGITNWLAGSYDFAGSDSPLKADQQTSAQTLCGTGGGLNLPVYLDGVAIIYKLDGVTKLNLSTETLAKIFSLAITTWNDPAIAADNPGVTLPSTAITTVARSDGSGTTQNFTNFLSASAPTVWTAPASNTWPITGNVSSQKGGSGVVQAVGAGSGTIGYADHSAIGDATAATINKVEFSQDAATAAFAAGATTVPTATGDLSQKFDYSKLTGTDVYPIPLVSYQIVCSTYKDAKQAELTKSFIGFVASTTGQKVAAKNAGSAPIPDEMLTKVLASLATVK
ncbi:phosphate ABC transporter substrate-binding protein PstS [Subtercola boreus]|uniref:Phosphate-binding protein n=1 Tax=Subtercola boreus TaxID=120213 RepID=A0A3E0W823_9MICO|nr:phosphate ABC transporter substrate-binding protein PstS [Subtercola boreus]RFA19344.1 phosphate-binding protein [Subtercola boreus]RFA19605.1 phosphate-binding protein [Subtercola boreus]RFA25970.1 phosphate-binding protein [Subtercola boreus]